MTRIPIDDDERQSQESAAGEPQDQQQEQVLEGEPADQGGSTRGADDNDVQKFLARLERLLEPLGAELRR